MTNTTPLHSTLIYSRNGALERVTQRKQASRDAAHAIARAASRIWTLAAEGAYAGTPVTVTEDADGVTLSFTDAEGAPVVVIATAMGKAPSTGTAH